MAVVEGGGGGKAGGAPSIGYGPDQQAITWGGFTFVVNKKDQSITLAGGKKLPAGSKLNVSKQTIDLPDGSHLVFRNGKVVQRVPKRSGTKVKYTETDYLTGKAQPNRSGDDNRQPVTPAPREGSWVAVNGEWVHVNGKGIVDTRGPYYGKYPQQVDSKAAKSSPGGTAPTGGGGSAPPTTAPTPGAIVGAPAASPSAPVVTGPTAGPTAPAPSNSPLSDSAVDTEVRRMFGEVAAFLSHPELGPILRQAAKEGWDSSRLFGKLQQTTFWRTTGDSARKWTILKTLDPATAKAQADAQMMSVAAISREAGFNYTPEQQRYFAELSLKNGWTGPQLREHLFAREATGAKESGGLDTAVTTQYGYLAAFLDHPEVGDILRRAAREGWSQQRLQAELQKTQWWRETTESQRQFDALLEQSPQEAQAAIETRRGELSALADSLGVRVDDDRLNEIAQDSLRYGWSQQQVRTAVTAEYEYGGGTETVENPMTRGQTRKRGRGPAGRAAGDTITVTTPNAGEEYGLAGQTAREIRAMAGQYLVPISDRALERWTEQIVRGETDMEGFNSYLVEQAKSLFPGMAAALDKGVTVAQYADPYRQIAARELEIAPESIDLNDPRYRAMLDQVNSKGERVSMTLSESAEYLRKLPEWQQTRGANERAASLTESILRTFGAVA
jgi:hypothetical protein